MLRGRVNHQVDPGIRGEPSAVDSEFEKAILHQHFAGGTDVLGTHSMCLDGVMPVTLST